MEFRKVIAGVVVTVLGGILLKVTSDAIDSGRAATATPTSAVATRMAAGDEGSAQSTVTPPVAPRVFDFVACAEPCTGSNATEAFPEGTTTIHARWNFSGIAEGASYLRTWTMDGMEWVRYDCAWPGPPGGRHEVTLHEPLGLHSGVWRLSISVDGAILLDESVVVEGDVEAWSPAGVFNDCYGD
jgi:hypothetical protein